MRSIPHADSPEFEELLREALKGYPCEPGASVMPEPRAVGRASHTGQR